MFISKVFISARPQRKVAQYTHLRYVSGPTSTCRKSQHFKPMSIKLILGSSATISVHIQFCHNQCAHSVLPQSVCTFSSDTISVHIQFWHNQCAHSVLPQSVCTFSSAIISVHIQFCHNQRAHSVLPQSVCTFSSATISVHIQSDSSHFTRRPTRVSARICSVTCWIFTDVKNVWNRNCTNLMWFWPCIVVNMWK